MRNKEHPRTKSLLLFVATTFLFVGTSGQGLSEADLRENMKKRLHKKFLNIREAVRENGLYAYSPRYRKWTSEQESLDVDVASARTAVVAAPEDSIVGEAKNIGRKKKRRRRRRRKGGRFRRRKKAAKRKRVNGESQPTRNLLEKSLKRTTGWWQDDGEVNILRQDDIAQQVRSDMDGQNVRPNLVHKNLRRGEMQLVRKKGWLDNESVRNERRAEAQGRAEGRRKTQDQEDIVYTEIGGIVFIISALSPFFQSGLVVPEVWCAGVDPLTWNGNVFTATHPNDLVLLNCLQDSLDNYTEWTLEVLDYVDDIPYTTAHLSDLNEITTEGERREQYNVWMSVENEIEENQRIKAVRTGVFDMAPVNEREQTWFFLAGPTGDRTWRPWPQDPYDRQLCAAAQRLNGTVQLGSDVRLKECDGSGNGRERQTWVYCGETFECGIGAVDPPLFNVYVVGEPDDAENDPGGIRGETFEDQRVTVNNFDPEDVSVQDCSFDEGDLVQGNATENWAGSFTMTQLGYNTTAVSSTRVDITMISECETDDSTDFGLDTIFRLYEDGGTPGDQWTCVRSARVSCDVEEGEGAELAEFQDVTLQKGNIYYIRATGGTEAEDCTETDFDCFF